MAIDINKSAIPLFQSPDRLELLNDIDKFRQHGLANLPQIVVCGDTSSGKSSVLEALSGIPFPVDSTMCTRFATEIALRYSSDKTVTGQTFISPAPRSSDSHQTRVQAFQKTVIAGLDAIPDILREAREVMGLGESGGISRDVLHLKLSGRQLPNLTLVDLSGLIHSATNSDDIANVQDLVKYYFKQKESLIMAIVSAENPIENQGILTLSRQFDPTGERTIGVITKPDILRRPDKARLTPTVLELARNQHAAFKFKRHWQIMRCLTDDERLRGANRDRIETDLFSQDPWDSFDKKRLGTKSLRAVLRYAQIVRDALDGDYSDSFFDDDDAGKRLRAQTMVLTDDFEQAMRNRGHKFEIKRNAFSLPSDPDAPERITMVEALAKVGKLIEGYRGPELPLLFNPRLVGELFKDQSQKWLKLSTEYTDAICRAVQVFLRKVVDAICPTTARVGELILREVFQEAIHIHQDKLNKKVSELFSPHTGSFLYSTKSRLQTSLKAVQSDDLWPVPVDAAAHVSVSSGARLGTPDSEGDPRLAALQLSRAYYSVALETFIQNVVVLGVESCLLSKLEEMFSPETVGQMKEDKLELLGGETPEMMTERTDLAARLSTLEAALKNCRRHASREFGLEQQQQPITLDSTATQKRASAFPSLFGNNHTVVVLPGTDDNKSSSAPVSRMPQVKVSFPPLPNMPFNDVTADMKSKVVRANGSFGENAPPTSTHVEGLFSSNRTEEHGFGTSVPQSTRSGPIFFGGGVFGGGGFTTQPTTSNGSLFGARPSTAQPATSNPSPIGTVTSTAQPAPSTTGLFGAAGGPTKQQANSGPSFGLARLPLGSKVFGRPMVELPGLPPGWPGLSDLNRVAGLLTRLSHGPEFDVHMGAAQVEVQRCLAEYQSLASNCISFEELRLRDYKEIFDEEVRRLLAKNNPGVKSIPHATYLAEVRSML
ncbi:hypothetical protein AYL99_08399 [Fonsecaea erecta]|uniref:GED domain-containing protein n=1 Tax=Fonsecaea erecta TaxID=1367422 RepID=A0A178ZDX8_9EURO|nr:hypothetical protein AYL99_08399 [Fonsecaea erecta]OAP57661.1 hypothetical protein AYL99_08399 [Fonsecaea erecta]